MVSGDSQHKSEVDTKLKRLRGLLAAHNVDGVLLNTTANIAWISAGGETFINEASDTGPAAVLVTNDRAYLLTDTIETPRLKMEQHFETLGFEFITETWYDRGHVSGPLMSKLKLGHDGLGGASGPDLSGAIRDLRMNLLPEETHRVRMIGELAAETMDEAARQTRPGDSEYLLAARLQFGGRVRGGQSIVTLVASDERIFTHRHPPPTTKRVEKYAMLVLCLRVGGLIVSITRLVHFGPLSPELVAKEAACARVAARMILGTKPGRTLAEMFEVAKQGYAAEGYPEAIEEHHQGGSGGYAGREYFATPGVESRVALNQFFAWNPSIKGVKFEDTILLTERGTEVVTRTPGWPVIEVEVEEGKVALPRILIYVITRSAAGNPAL